MYDFEHKEKDLYRIFGDEDLSECNRFDLVFPLEIKDLKGWIIDVKDRLTTEIKNAMQEMVLGTNEINNAIVDVNDATSNNREELVNLNKQVATFRLY